MENKNWQLASTFIFFLNIRKWKMKMYVQFFFFFSEMWKPMFDFHFLFLDIEKWKKQNKTKKRKENVYLLLIFSEKWRIINLSSIFNFQWKQTPRTMFFCCFLFCVRYPDPLLLELNKMATIESLLDRGGERGYCVIRD